jgi:hypothetical protein
MVGQAAHSSSRRLNVSADGEDGIVTVRRYSLKIAANKDTAASAENT